MVSGAVLPRVDHGYSRLFKVVTLLCTSNITSRMNRIVLQDCCEGEIRKKCVKMLNTVPSIE